MNTALHLRGPCKRDHPVTLDNTVSVGIGNGYRCKECRKLMRAAA